MPACVVRIDRRRVARPGVASFRRMAGRGALPLFLLLSACAPLRERAPGAPAPAEAQAAPAAERYEAEANLDAAAIGRLRAAPAPAATPFQPGTLASTDEDRLGMQGLVRVGSGIYSPRVEVQTASSPARQRAQALGADLALVYPAADGATRVAFYVRMALPFGATFRDLDAAERAQVGAGGVALGSIVGGSPASRANLLPGDLVLQVDGVAVDGKTDFQRHLRARAGHRVTLLLWRHGERLQRPVRLGVPPVR